LKKTLNLAKTKKLAKKKTLKFYKWLHKSPKLRWWQIFLIAYLIFSILYIFVPRGSTKVVQSIAVFPTAKAVKPLTEPDIKPVESLTMADYPLASYGTFFNDYAWGNCTAYVASRVHVPNSLGNANQWDDKASVVSNVPVVGMVAQTDAGWAGHVAVVEAVNGNTVTVSEMNYTGFNMVDTRTTPISDWVYLAWN